MAITKLFLRLVVLRCAHNVLLNLLNDSQLDYFINDQNID